MFWYNQTGTRLLNKIGVIMEFGWILPALSSLWSFMVGAAPVITAGTAIYEGVETTRLSKEASRKQEKAQAEAERKQKEADDKAEKARLEALAKNQQDENKFNFGVDSALAKRYADAAQKWGAGTGEMSEEEEEENPFYSRGLF